MKKLTIGIAFLAIAIPAFAGIYYLKGSRPLNGSTYERIYDVGGRDMISYQQWSCKPYIDM